MATPYDEDLTPEVDPPVVEPPPAATLIGRIFAHRRPPATVVQALLVPAEAYGMPPASAAEVPGMSDAVAADEAVAGEPGRSDEAVAEEPGRSDEAVAEEPGTAEEPLGAVEPAGSEMPEVAPAADRPVGTRYCATCGERVPLAADGLRCARGHRLSPAHARRRGLFRGRR